MTDRERIEQAIDQGPWGHLLALADLCEEEGDTASAAGYRHLAGHRRHPCRQRQGWAWFHISDVSEGAWDCLPHGAWEILRASRPDWPYFPTPSEAYRLAALAVGTWLAAPPCLPPAAVTP